MDRLSIFSPKRFVLHSFKYFLLSLMLMLFYSCEKKLPTDLSKLSESERQYWIKHYEQKRRQYYQGSRYKQECFGILQKLDPTNEFYFREKSVTHSKIGDYHIAFPLLEQSKAISPSESLYYYAWLLVNLYHDYERGLQYLEEYDALTPDQLDYAHGENVYHLKGLANRQLGNYDEAIQNFTQAIESEGDYPDVYDYVYRGICQLQKQEYQKAIADFDTAIQSYDKSSMAYYYRGLALDQIGQRKNALESLEKARGLLKLGYKLSDPYKEVIDEVHIAMIDDYLKL